MLRYLVVIGFVVNLWGVWAYTKDTLKGKTKPNRVTWFMWGVAPLIATVAAFSDGVRWAVLPTFSSGIGPLIIFGASFVNPNAYWKLGKLDYLCGLLSIFALILWALTREASVAIFFAILSDALAGIPTLFKIWKHPETETPLAYTTSLFAILTSFFAIPVWTFSQYAFPVYLTISNTVLLIGLYKKKLGFA
jgi:hypothetical protein